MMVNAVDEAEKTAGAAASSEDGGDVDEQCTEAAECTNPDAIQADEVNEVDAAKQDYGEGRNSPEGEAVEEEDPDPRETQHEEAAQSDNSSASGDEAAETKKKKESNNCPDRDQLIRCAAFLLDSNKNGKLDRLELQAAIDGLPWYAGWILNVLGSLDKMMRNCDIDKDDAISIDYDMEHNKESCLHTCFKRRAFKAAFFPDCDL